MKNPAKIREINFRWVVSLVEEDGQVDPAAPVQNAVDDAAGHHQVKKVRYWDPQTQEQNDQGNFVQSKPMHLPRVVEKKA